MRSIAIQCLNTAHIMRYNVYVCNFSPFAEKIISSIEIGLSFCSLLNSSNINITSFASIDLLCYGNIGTQSISSNIGCRLFPHSFLHAYHSFCIINYDVSYETLFILRNLSRIYFLN